MLLNRNTVCEYLYVFGEKFPPTDIATFQLENPN